MEMVSLFKGGGLKLVCDALKVVFFLLLLLSSTCHVAGTPLGYQLYMQVFFSLMQELALEMERKR